MSQGITNVVGIDDGPFTSPRRDRVRLIGAVCARTRLDGVISGFVRRDGTDATARIIRMITTSPFVACTRAILLQGIAVGGFNVVDIHMLWETLRVPVLTVMRRKPDFEKIKEALFAYVQGAEEKWALIERAGLPEAAGPVWIQRVGIERQEAELLLKLVTGEGNIPEPLRLAHIIAGGVTDGASRGRA